uniref:uncharacterized protein LOC120827526 n=1 Tax=Gasterosteus aculeatus aculeatus TaxID=481459 RepID=UPI001A982238|nr:uncharacterized protein LOC120827526 [Gasterosteus aculeatus aculeatus]
MLSPILGGKTPPKHLKMVMVGAQWSAKSSAGNTILRKQAFAVDHNRTTKICEMSHSMVADRLLTVVDSPGWYYNNTLHDTCKMDKAEIENIMHLCPPGPHAVLLVVGLASAFNASYWQAVQQHMRLFKDEVWNHTIVLFTRGDWLGRKTVEERIESEEGLQWLVEKCGNMYHVLDNTKRDDEAQVTELLEKIEEMWAGNKAPLYEVDLGRAEEMEARKTAKGAMAKRIRKTSQRQDRILRELFRGERQSITDVRVVLVGRKDSGKSMVGNWILSEELFDSTWMKKEFQNQRGTTTCVKHEGNTSGVNFSVVEAPGWSRDLTVPDMIREEVKRGVSMCSPGPHTFLIAVPLSQSFTKADYEAVVEVLTPFGERVWRHCMVMFTWAEWLNNRSIEEHIAAEGKALRKLVEQCGFRYHAASGARFVYPFPINELYQKMLVMMTRNKGHYFAAEVKKKKPMANWQEEWNRREQELIDRMLKAVAQEPDEPLLPPVKMTASSNGAFLPNFSRYRDVWSPKARHWVSEWLTIGAVNSEGTSGIGSMTASYAGKLENDPLMTTFFHRKRRNEVRSSPRQILHRRPTEALSLSKTEVAYTSRQNVRVMGHTIQYRTHNTV